MELASKAPVVTGTDVAKVATGRLGIVRDTCPNIGTGAEAVTGRLGDGRCPYDVEAENEEEWEALQGGCGHFPAIARVLQPSLRSTDIVTHEPATL